MALVGTRGALGAPSGPRFARSTRTLATTKRTRAFSGDQRAFKGGKRWPTGGPSSGCGAPGAPGAPLERFLWIFWTKGARKRAAENSTFAEVAVNRPGRV